MLVIIPCGARKQAQTAPACALYTGPYFRACLRYALSIASPRAVRILSAKHGFLALDTVIHPYEMTFQMSGHISFEQLQAQVCQTGLSSCTPVIAVGGTHYVTLCRRLWPECFTPLPVVGMGQQMQWLRRHHGQRSYVDPVQTLHV